MPSPLRAPQQFQVVGSVTERSPGTLTWQPDRQPAAAEKADRRGPTAAGIALQAADTGRVLMLQRAMSDGDPAAGMWEFPGGRLDPGETALGAARREWQEETGCTLPESAQSGGVWDSKDGVYRGFVYSIPHEADIPVLGDRDEVINPDDPDGDQSEALAWWDPRLLKRNPAVRPEVVANRKRLKAVLAPMPVTKGITQPELVKVGPKGYIHGWIKVGPGSVGDVVEHPELGRGVVTRAGAKTTAIRFDSGVTHAFEHKPHGGEPEHFVARPAPTRAPRKTTSVPVPRWPPSPAPARRAAARPPAQPVDIHSLFNADDATIEAALRDVFEGQFGPYTTKVTTYIRRGGGISASGWNRGSKIEPSIGVDGKIYDAAGLEIGHFGRSIEPSVVGYHGGVQRREVWAEHQVVEIGARYQGKGFGGAFNKRAIDWYRASGVHGISQSDHNFYTWASQGFNFSGGVMPEYKQEELRNLIAALRAGNQRNQYGETIPKRLREAADLQQQTREAEALLQRAQTHSPGEVGYPTAYEVSQLGRNGRRGKTSTWLGKYLGIAADEMILNPDEGQVVQQ